jgi:hypothetical protein
MVQISATCPLNERSGSCREFADRDFVWQDFYVLENSDSPSSDSLQDSDTCPPEIYGYDPSSGFRESQGLDSI